MEKLQESVNLLIGLCFLILVFQVGSCAYITKDHDVITAGVWNNGFEIRDRCRVK